MNIPNSIWTLLIGIVLTLVSLWYGQNHGLLPIAASDEAVLVDGLFNAMMTVSVGLFLLVEGVLIYTAFKYRRRPGDNSDAPPVFGNVPLEILWTAIPAIIVMGISIYSFDVYNSIGGFNPHDVHDTPVTQEAVRMPGAAIAATLSDTPPVQVPTSIKKNLSRQGKILPLQQFAMTIKFPRKETLQAQVSFLPQLDRVLIEKVNHLD